VGETRKTAAGLAMLMTLLAAGCGLWALHAESWSLGRRSPVLSYDTSQYALAARELAQHGRLATTYALPIELARHPQPPWPLALVQPGLVLLEALAFRLAPAELELGGRSFAQWSRPDQMEWLVIPILFTCYVMCGILLGLATAKLLRRHAPGISDATRMAAGGTVGLALLLDPEAQHFGVGGFTELPFTCGLVGALALLALDRAQRRPLLFGLLLGVTGSFRLNMLWLAPALVAAAAALAPRDGRGRVAGWALLGFVIPLAPWWIYKWLAFGTPAWDLGHYVIWDGVQGRTWFTLNHLPETPRLPHGAEAIRLLAAKTLHNLPGLLLASTTGLRALWLGALVAWIAVAREPRTLRAVAIAVLAVFTLGLIAAAAGVPGLRYAFPGRVVLEAAGIRAVGPDRPGAADRDLAALGARAARRGRRPRPRVGRMADRRRKPGGARRLRHARRARNPDDAPDRGPHEPRDRPRGAGDEQPRADAGLARAASGRPPGARARGPRGVPEAARLPPRAAGIPRPRARLGRMERDRRPSAGSARAARAQHRARAALPERGRIHLRLARAQAARPGARLRASMRLRRPPRSPSRDGPHSDYGIPQALRVTAVVAPSAREAASTCACSTQMIPP